MILQSTLGSLTSARNPISLQPLPSKALSILLVNEGGFVNTFEFREVGIPNPSQCIAQLKAKGAIIEKQIKPATDGSGASHNRVAWYSLQGWAKL